MGRFQPDLLERVEVFADRVLTLTDALDSQRRPRRVIEQIAASGTSVGANTFEADEALSRADFCKSIGIVLKELNETRFWLRLISRRGWIAPDRLVTLLDEADQLKLIFGAILSRSRTTTPKRTQRRSTATKPTA